MKSIILIITTIFIYSCNSNTISEKDMQIISAYVSMHNSTVGLDMKLKDFKVDTTLVGYSPYGDPDLTVEKVIEYCKKNKLNPVEFSKTLYTK